MNPLVVQLIPLFPGLLKWMMDVVSAATAEPGTPEETKLQLDALSAELKSVAAKVAAVELPDAA